MCWAQSEPRSGYRPKTACVAKNSKIRRLRGMARGGATRVTCRTLDIGVWRHCDEALDTRHLKYEDANVLHLKSATELVADLREGRTSSVELTRAFLDHIAANDGAINAVVRVEESLAMEAAQRADRARSEGQLLGPLHGLPMTLKDAMSTRDMVTTMGMRINRNKVSAHDAEIVRRLRAAGAHFLGKTNVPMACLDWQCHSPIYGRCNNPWHLEHVPGGSSRGSAAALAMGFTPLEVGSDLGGSIRYPAHCCGVYGLRPTEGTISLHHVGDDRYPDAIRNLVVVGPMARTVDDLSLLFEVLSGRPETRSSKPVFGDLRVGYTAKIGQIAPSKEYQTIFDTFIGMIENDCTLVEAPVPEEIDLGRCIDVWGCIAGYESTSAMPAPFDGWLLRQFIRHSGILRRAWGPGAMAKAMSYGMGATRRAYLWALTERDGLRASMSHFLESVDIWITPCSPLPAIAHQRTGAPITVDGVERAYTAVLDEYMVPWSLRIIRSWSCRSDIPLRDCLWAYKCTPGASMSTGSSPSCASSPNACSSTV